MPDITRSTVRAMPRTPTGRARLKRDEALTALYDAANKLEKSLADWPGVPGRIEARDLLRFIDGFLSGVNQ